MADVAPDELHGVPFADADVTDESVAERALQEEPEVWEQRAPRDDSEVPVDERLGTIVDLGDDDG